MPMRRALVLATLVGALAPSAAAAKRCDPVVNPYPDTRFEDVDLTRIRATGVGCETARRVARGSHRKALGLTPPASGIRTFDWQGWAVRGNLRPAHDRYTALEGARRVTYRF